MSEEPTDQELIEKIDAAGQSRCENCAFWRKVEGSDRAGLCKAGDPRVGPRNNVGVWPVVSGDGSCGKYEQSSEQSLEAKLVGDLEMRRRQRLELADKAERKAEEKLSSAWEAEEERLIRRLWVLPENNQPRGTRDPGLSLVKGFQTSSTTGGYQKMAMTPTVFSISGLATELGYDRRTIADALRHHRPDGKVGHHDGWYLTTALRALNSKRSRFEPSIEQPILVEIMLDRLKLTPRKRSHMEFALDQFARLVGQDCETVLVWIRAGMPYGHAGDWKTGAGFSIRMPHALEWLALVGAHVEQCNDQAALRALRLDQF